MTKMSLFTRLQCICELRFTLNRHSVNQRQESATGNEVMRMHNKPEVTRERFVCNRWRD